MRRSARANKTIILAAVFLLILIGTVAESAYGSATNRSDTNYRSLNITENNSSGKEETSNSLSDSSAPANRSENQSLEGPYDVHVYVFNNDDDRLKVSLFIDSELMESKEISAESETKFDIYPLQRGLHAFKISWWEEDVKRSFEVEETKQIENETSVNLYTSLNDEPEEYEISIKLANENAADLEAYLYVDGNFEKNKAISKESTSDLGTIKLEEGVHNLSVRWRDTDTKIEYEKKKKILADRDDAVVFYVPAGVSFDAIASVPSSKTTAVYSKDTDKQSSTRKDSTIKDSSVKDTTSDKTKSVENKSGTSNANETSNGASSKPSNSDATSTNKAKIDFGYTSGSGYSDKSPNSKKTSSFSGGFLEDSNNLYIYSAVVILAVYLIFRH